MEMAPASNPATPGNTVMLSIDIKLQALVEQLYGDRRGALVAIDPRNGDVLAFVSMPNFDPNQFVDGIDADGYPETEVAGLVVVLDGGAADVF